MTEANEIMPEISKALKSAGEIKVLTSLINDKILLKQLISLGLSTVTSDDKTVFENYARVATAELSEINSTISFYEEQRNNLTRGEE